MTAYRGVEDPAAVEGSEVREGARLLAGCTVPEKPHHGVSRPAAVTEEPVKFTLLTRDISGYLTDRYSERKEDTGKLKQRVGLTRI